MEAKITKRSVEAVKPDRRDSFIYDKELRGFGCKITPAGRRSYFVRTLKNGRRHFVKLGEHGALTAVQARERAAAVLAEIAGGGDPSGARNDARSAPTVAELTERYMSEYAEPHKKPSSLRNDRTNIDTHIVPALGSKRVPDVKREDIARLHNALRATPIAANRVLALLSKLFNLAEAWGLRPDGTNPCRHVTKYRENKRERYLSDLELKRLGRVLESGKTKRQPTAKKKATKAKTAKNGKAKDDDDTIIESPYVIAAIRLLLFTGARLGEILGLRWEYVDFERKCLRLPDSKTGAKVVQLNTAALDVLATLDNDKSAWVIPGARANSHLVNLEKPWRRIRKAAKLEDVRLHDLRHSFASVAAGHGATLSVIGKQLGHTQAATTQRYAHLTDSAVKETVDKVGAHLAKAMSGRGLHAVK